MPKKRPAQFRGSRRTAVRVYWAMWGLCAAVWLYPVGNDVIRIMEVILTASCVVWTFILWWPARWLWGIAGLVTLLLIWPGRDYDRIALREAIAARLPAYEGTRWVWGGENFLGMDGPGLARRSAIEGTALHGLKTCNPRLLRMALSVWWSGFPSKSPDAKPPKTVRVVSARNLHLADFAVYGNKEFEVYAGDGVWFCFHPDGYVSRTRDVNSASPFAATVYRWRYLEMPR